jgi:ribosome-associated heat shock protein Hsp15
MGRPVEDSSGEQGGGASLRIDRWLWCTRHFKSRTLAADAVAGGRVHLNGGRVKPAHALRVGDRVAITRPGYVFECEVLSLPQQRGSAPVAQASYREIDESKAARAKYSEQSRLASALRPQTIERPDKHGRRELRRLRGRD